MRVVSAALLFVAATLADSTFAAAQEAVKEEIQPPVVEPGMPGMSGSPGKPPSDAVVLFSGKDLAAFTGPSGDVKGWAVRKGELVCTARHENAEKTGTWDLQTKEAFGAMQLHVEFFIPLMKKAKEQARANSGIYLQNRYEVQILDSYQNPTYPMGTLGAVYGHSAPQVIAARKPGQWQSYDIVFHPATCNGDGSTKDPGSVTTLLNGVLVQDHALIFPKKGCDPSPGVLRFQDHYHPDVVVTPIKLRNVWLRKLAARKQ